MRQSFARGFSNFDGTGAECVGLDDTVGDRRHFDHRECAGLPVQIDVTRTNELILPIDHAPANFDALDDPLGQRRFTPPRIELSPPTSRAPVEA